MRVPDLDPDHVDPLAKLLVDDEEVPDFEAAAEALRRYRVQVVVGEDVCRDPAWQAALLTMVNAGVRALPGEVIVVMESDPVVEEVPLALGRRLSESLGAYGARFARAPSPFVPTIVIGDVDDGMVGRAVYPFAGRWSAGVSTRALAPGGPVSVLAAVFAGALAVSEVFQHWRGYPVAMERDVRVSLWAPGGDPMTEGPPITQLPSEIWLLGLGHLGQAYSWLLGLLPYAPEGRRPLVLQDDDRLSVANRATAMLHTSEGVGERKTRGVARVLEPLGWDTRLVERRYEGGRLCGTGEPALLLAGVDNAGTRRAFDDAGFEAVFDAGLGAGADSYLDMSIRRLPASRPPAEFFPDPGPMARERRAAAYDRLEQETRDQCGVELLAGRAVGTAFVGVTAACWVIGGVLRELHGGPRIELVGHSLRDPAEVVVVPGPAVGGVIRVPTSTIRGSGSGLARASST
ncbi:MAG: hypothetical protein AB7I38_15180 [Dehalococcoidia bacterium]